MNQLQKEKHALNKKSAINKSENNMKTKLTNSFAGALAFLLALTGQSQASTFVSGNVSGTWNTAGSPYVATANVTVPGGQTLTIQPGVTFIIGQGLTVEVNGTINAIGTGAAPIIIRGANSSLYWDRIYINDTGSTQSRFANCIISDATNALFFSIYAAVVGNTVGNVSMSSSVQNCVFTNCVGACVYGRARGGYCGNPWARNDASLLLDIRNCRFGTSGCGCVFLADGGDGYPWSGNGYGSVNPAIVNCDFISMTNCGINFTAGAYAAATQPHVQNCIFVQCTKAMKNDALSVFNDASGYNCFFNNATNFAGYPVGVYGTICCQNDRGTPCDLANNIFSNPLFAETNTYTLATNSPCIDAGTPDWALSDMCFPPSQGAAVTDIGIYGGPHAANWLNVVPLVPASASMSIDTNNVVSMLLGCIPRSEYQLQFITNILSTNWTDCSKGWVRAVNKPTTMVIATNPAASQMYFRVQSLGRTPGN